MTAGYNDRKWRLCELSIREGCTYIMKDKRSYKVEERDCSGVGVGLRWGWVEHSVMKGPGLV